MSLISQREPLSDSDAGLLSLDVHGKSVSDSIYTRDIIDEAYIPLLGPNIYKSFIASMDKLKTEQKINDWAAVPYDWRLSFDDILLSGTKVGGNISYNSTSSDPYILSELRRLAASSKTGKVTIIAHSNGGLVAKVLLIAHPELNQYVDKLIFVDVPQVGTPQAVAALLHGFEQGIPATFPLFLSQHAARSFAHNAPVAYNLLPSFGYFSSVFDPVISIDPVTLPDWVSRYGTTIGLEGQLKNFLSHQHVALV
jgi:pimeloyl-ACP methyl ester carboxylesterase